MVEAAANLPARRRPHLWSRGDPGESRFAVNASLGLAVVLVVLSHADANRLIWIEWLLPYKGSLGTIGIYVFFLLAGMMAWRSAERTLARPNGVAVYFAKGARGTAPLYYAALLFAVLVFPYLAGAYQQNVTAYTLLKHVFLVHSLGGDVSRAINPILWPVSYAVILLAAVPLLFRWAHPRWLILAVLGVVTGAAWMWPSAGLTNFSRAALLFSIGVLASAFRVRPGPLLMPIACAAAVAASLGGANPTLVNTLWAVALCVSFLALDRFGLRQQWPAAALARIGVVSLSVYIWHYLLIDILGLRLARSPITDHSLLARSAVFIALLGIVSWASYRWIEVEGAKRLAGRAIRRSMPRESASPVRARLVPAASEAPPARAPSAWAVGAALMLISIPFLMLEAFARTNLFDVASYTNSEKFDKTMQSLQNAKGAVVGAFGSSETLYGFDPHTFQAESERLGCGLPAFNFGVEGFGPNHYLILLENLPFTEWAPRMKIALVGLTLFEPQEPMPTTAEAGFQCDSMAGSLQRSVYTSPLARDMGMEGLCRAPGTEVLRPVEDALSSVSAAFRYRSAIRALVLDTPAYLGRDRQSRMARVTDRGFYMAPGMTAENVDFYTDRWLKDFSQVPFWQKPLNEDTWTANLAEGGLLSRIKDRFLAMKVMPVFYSMPTNPLMVTSVRREDVYVRNSERMRAWAKKNAVGFIDTGILRDFDPIRDFGDHRHTSAEGAAKASALLAQALTKMDAGQAACVNRGPGRAKDAAQPRSVDSTTN